MQAAERKRLYQLQLQLVEATDDEELHAYVMLTRSLLERQEWLSRRLTGHADLDEHDADGQVLILL